MERPGDNEVVTHSFVVTRGLIRRLWRFKVDRDFKTLRDALDFLLKEEGY